MCFRSCVLFFRYDLAQSTCLGPKLSFWVISRDSVAWRYDEDIPPNDTPMPTTQHGPMTRARVGELNYQVNSFLAVHKPSSMNGVLLNSCDAFLILRNLGHEPDWRESKHDKKASVDDQIGPYQFGPPGRGNFGRP